MIKTILTIFNPENEFFLLTKDAKRLTHIAFSSLLLPVLFVMAASLSFQFGIVPLIISNPQAVPPLLRSALSLYLIFGFGIFYLFLWVKFYEGRPFYTIGFTRTGALNKYLLGFGTGMLAISLIVGIMAIFGGIEIAKDSVAPTGVEAIGGVVILLFGFVVQGASEEILTRGWMFQVIGARYKPWLGALITSVLFAALHLSNTGVNIFAVLNLFLFAVLMTLYVMRNRSLWVACAWHSSWNWTMGNVFGLSVSGTGERATFINLNTTGSEIISGGGFGPEGSIITTVVLLTFVLWNVYSITRNK